MRIERIQRTTTPVGESNAYSLFVYAIRSQITKDYYLRRLRIFFNHINFHPELTLEDRCNLFAEKGIKDPNWAFNCVVNFSQFQKERVEKEEITGATLRNYVKAIKLFCEMSDIPIAWKKISRGLPKIRRYADRSCSNFKRNSESMRISR